MKRQYFIPAFWAMLTGLSLLLIAAMTDVKTPESLFISPHHARTARSAAPQQQILTNKEPLLEVSDDTAASTPAPQPAPAQQVVVTAQPERQPEIKTVARTVQATPVPQYVTPEVKTAANASRTVQTRTLVDPTLEQPSETPSTPKRSRAIQFHLAEEVQADRVDPTEKKMEMRLASLTRQVDRLTNLQLEVQQQSKMELAQNTDRLEQATKLLQQMQQMNQLRDLERKLDGMQDKDDAAAQPKTPA
ncbi:MAG: hypothetical protein RLO18_05805, partial [Gimesia chilikensis]